MDILFQEMMNLYKTDFISKLPFKTGDFIEVIQKSEPYQTTYVSRMKIADIHITSLSEKYISIQITGYGITTKGNMRKDSESSYVVMTNTTTNPEIRVISEEDALKPYEHMPDKKNTETKNIKQSARLCQHYFSPMDYCRYDDTHHNLKFNEVSKTMIYKGLPKNACCLSFGSTKCPHFKLDEEKYKEEEN